MRSSILFSIVLSAAVLFPRGSLRAQDPAPPALPDSIQGLLAEFGTLRARFESAQQQALESDAQLRQKQQEIRDLVTATVLRLRPHVGELYAVLPQINAAAVAAEQSGEVARLEALIADHRRIQAEIENAQAEAIEEPEVAREIAAFEQRMIAGMRAFEPDIQGVLDRMQAIAARLQVWMGGAPPA